MGEEKWPTWVVSYGFEGKQWTMRIVARDMKDAKARIDAASALGTVDGRLIMSVPAAVGWWIPLVAWLRNRLSLN